MIHPSRFLGATALLVALSGPLPGVAQVAGSDLAALLAQVEQTCAATPDSCEAAVADAMATIRATATGANATAINAQIGAVVGTVTALYDRSRAANTLPPAVLQSLANAVSVAADPARGYVGTPGTPSYDGLVSAVTTVASDVGAGRTITESARSTSQSGTPS